MQKVVPICSKEHLIYECLFVAASAGSAIWRHGYFNRDKNVPRTSVHFVP